MTASRHPPQRRLRVAMAGIRGIPANFGGSETAVQEIGRRLADQDVEVVVYCRAHQSANKERRFLGMRRIVLPSINTFHLDTITHSVLSTLHLRLRDTADVIHYHGMGNALCIPLLVGSGKRSVVTIDGPDWERPKWGPFARRVLKLGARIATRSADGLIIDNLPSLEYFRREFDAEDAVFIPYGADRERPDSSRALADHGLEPRGYVLFVGALVPDKGPDILLEAYREVRTSLPLVIVGDSPFFSDYRKQLHETAGKDERVKMLGYVYGDGYRELVAHAYAYVHPLRADGTSPALLQAMGFGSCIVINSLPEALSAVGDAAIPYAQNDVQDLARQLRRVLDDPELAEDYRRRARRRAEEEYDWDRVTAAHRDLYERALR